MKQLSILAFEALPHEGVPSTKWHKSPRSRSLPRQELAASLRGVLGSDQADELGHECPVYVDSGRNASPRTCQVRPEIRFRSDLGRRC
jgi:hypothetical protein